jgi:hypothetical protein
LDLDIGFGAVFFATVLEGLEGFGGLEDLDGFAGFFLAAGAGLRAGLCAMFLGGKLKERKRMAPGGSRGVYAVIASAQRGQTSWSPAL